MFLLVIEFKMMGMQLNVVHVPGPKKLTKTYKESNGFLNYSTIITMFWFILTAEPQIR